MELFDKIKELAKKLNRELVGFDLETTGFSPDKNEIIEFSFIKFNPDGEVVWDFSKLCKPKTPIPEIITEVTGITNSDVENKKMFSEYANEIHRECNGATLCGYNNIRFDTPFLNIQLISCGLDELDIPDQIDVYKLYSARNKLNLSAAHLKYVGVDLDGAHRARVDVVGTMNVLAEMVDRHDIQSDELLIEMVKTPIPICCRKFIEVKDDKIVICFGKKHQGKELTDPRCRDYIKWIAYGYFPKKLKDMCKHILSEPQTK